MAMDRARVAVEIYGTSYKLVGSSTEYMKQVARYVDEHMRTISKSHSRLDTPRIAVLAAVHMAEQALQVQDVKNELNMLTGERSELRLEVSRLLEVQRERQEAYEQLDAAAKEEARRLIEQAEEERKRYLEAEELERQLHMEELQKSEQAASELRRTLESELKQRELELQELRSLYEQEQAASREQHRQELADAEALRLLQVEELKAAHRLELESIRDELIREKTETLSSLEQELAATKESLGKELSEEREALQREQARNKEMRQSQGTQEHRHKQQVLELEKQLSELRGGTGQLQSRMRAAEAGLKGERDARMALLAQYEAVIEREKQLEEEFRSAAEQSSQLNDELEGLLQRYELTQNEASVLRKSLQETGDHLRRVQNELALSTSESEDWQKLAVKRMEDISELEMNLLEAEDKSLTLQKEIEVLHGQADGLVQKLEQETGLRTEAERECAALREQEAAARKELTALRGRYEALISQYDEVLQNGEMLQERCQLLEAESEEAGLRLEELAESAREAAASAADQLDTLTEAAENGAAWKRKYDELVEQQRQWSDSELKLREEIGLWQQEAGEAEGRHITLERERSEAFQQLGELGENYELVMGQLRLLQAQFDQRQVELEQLSKEHRGLQAEYAKLQVEYNEWIQLIEQDN